MTDASPDPMHDEVLWFGIELAAVAKPRDAAAFKTLLMRFTEAVVREAFEHQDEIRERLAIALPRVNEQHADHDGPSRGAQCPGCHATIVGPFAAHVCERRRELGLIDSSTGAAEAEPKADIHTGETDAASVTPPAAPSTKSTLPAADRPSAAPSREGAESATGGAASLPPLADLDSTRDAASSSTTTKEHDRSLADAGCLPQPLAAPDDSARAADSGTSPAGVSAGAEASHNGRRMGPQQLTALRAAYQLAIDANGGELPRGWLTQQAKASGFTQQAISDRVRAWRREPAPPKREPVPDYVAGEDLAHTETPQCWCRKQQPTREKPWCKLRTVQKPASQHAALRAPEPRVRRIIGTRY